VPFAEINLIPSVNTETSPADNPSGAQESNFVRWRAALPEKRGGCTLYLDQAVEGAPVSLKPWASFQGGNYLGIATPNKVYAYDVTNTSLKDISPLYYDSLTASPTFTTAVGSEFVTITDATEPGVTLYDSVQFNTPVSVGGLILNGIYPVQSPAGVNTYVIDAGYAATSTETAVAGTLPVFQTTNSLSRVIVTFPIQYQFDSLAAGDRIGFTIQTTVGGIPIIGSYVVLQILGSTSFTFQAQYSATSTDTQTMNGGFVSLRYWITTPPNNAPP